MQSSKYFSPADATVLVNKQRTSTQTRQPRAWKCCKLRAKDNQRIHTREGRPRREKEAIHSVSDLKSKTERRDKTQQAHAPTVGQEVCTWHDPSNAPLEAKFTSQTPSCRGLCCHDVQLTAH